MGSCVSSSAHDDKRSSGRRKNEHGHQRGGGMVSTSSQDYGMQSNASSSNAYGYGQSRGQSQHSGGAALGMGQNQNGHMSRQQQQQQQQQQYLLNDNTNQPTSSSSNQGRLGPASRANSSDRLGGIGGGKDSNANHHHHNGSSSAGMHGGHQGGSHGNVASGIGLGSNGAMGPGSSAGKGGGGVMTGAESKREQRERSYQIDKQIEEDSKKYRKECKILLLGSGESGKSTVVKQMKIIHQNGYSKDELVLCRATVYKNVMDSAQALVMALRKFKMDPIEPVNRVYADKIMDYRLESSQTLASEIVSAVESLWHDPIIPSVLDRSSEFYMMDSASYFFDEIARIGAIDYVPNEADVLHARTKTTGISETKFRSGQLSIHMFDVGGQRSERKKWIHCFEAVTSIIFCVALSEYDQVLLEESGQNRMAESLVLFESVINSRWFLRTSIILFLNKIDLFKVKLPKVPLEKYFPEYTGGADVNKAAKYILWRFTQLNRARLSIYPHLTQATDTGNIRLVFAAVKETILQNALRDSGIL